MTVATLPTTFADIMGAHVELVNSAGASRATQAETAARKRLDGLLAGLSAQDRAALEVACSAIARRVASL